MDDLIQQIQTEFANGASEFKIRSDLLSLASGSAPDNGLQTIANLIALSNRWKAVVDSDCVTFTPTSDEDIPFPNSPSAPQ